jgi:hypothetical protein
MMHTFTPEDKYAREAYAVVRAARKKEQRLDRGQITMSSGREYLVLRFPMSSET